MAETGTFSSAVDDCIARSGRPDRRADIVSYLRTTMRETQVKAFFGKDLVEDQITGVAADPYIWTRPAQFRQMITVKYPGLYDPQGNQIFAKFIEPGKLQLREDFYYYNSGTSLVFTGMSGGSGTINGSTNIDVAYYSYFTPLHYFAAAERPATYDDQTLEWSFLSAATALEQEAAMGQVTNWLLFDWYDLVLEGTLAKVYKTANDVRAPTTFALFKQLQDALLMGESRMAMAGNR